MASQKTLPSQESAEAFIAAVPSDARREDAQKLCGLWFEVEVGPRDPCGDGIHGTCGPTTYDYYNARTGQQQVPVITDSETVDLNAPTLTRPLCAPLLEPAGYSPTTFTGWTLTFDGSFAIAQEPSGISVERCGSDLNVPLVEPPYQGALTVLPRAAAFCSSATEGYFLPSLQPFAIDALPFTVGLRPDCPLLAPRHADAIDAQGQLWAAPLPRQLQNLTSTQRAAPHEVLTLTR